MGASTTTKPALASVTRSTRMAGKNVTFEEHRDEGAAARIRRPLSVKARVSDAFRVKQCRHEPLWISRPEQDIAVAVLSACAPLEAYLRAKLHSFSEREQATRLDHCNTMLEHAEQELQRVSGDSSRCIDRYIHYTGMASLCPRVAAWCMDEPIASDRGVLDDYFAHLSHINAITSLCDVIAGDVENAQFKHLAHQVALLYQAVVHCGRPLEAYRQAIETRFTKLKSATRTDDSNTPIGLPPDLRFWLLFLLQRLKEDVLRMPPLAQGETADIVAWLMDDDDE